MGHREATLTHFRRWAKEQGIELENKTFLDVGCRNYANREFCTDNGLIWIGTDSEPEFGDIIQCKMEDMKLHQQFDIIFVCHSLEHCERPLDALRNFKEHLKKGGVLYISTPCPCDHHIMNSDEDHIFVLNGAQWKKLLDFAGYKNIEIHKIPEGGNHKKRYNIISIGKNE